MRLPRLLGPAVLIGALLMPAAPASADITAFLGIAGGPTVREALGVALSGGPGVIGWELEYSYIGSGTFEQVGSSSLDLAGAPRLQTGMANIVIQAPVDVRGMQFYGTGGAGFYHQDLGGLLSESNFATNMGGGLKMTLGGPLRLRVDYRLFRLSGASFGDRWVSRFYVGANVAF